MRTAQVRDILLEAGFANTEASGAFSMYEYPSPRDRREQNILTFIRATFHDPASHSRPSRSDGSFQMWINNRGSGRTAMVESTFHGVIDDADVLLDAVNETLGRRLAIAVTELVKWDDERLEGAPKGLVEMANSPWEERHTAEIVLTDWLLEHGVVF